MWAWLKTVFFFLDEKVGVAYELTILENLKYFEHSSNLS
jgi:ABC-type transport system involved in cytochrome c biogenesis ATPase subunit